MAPPDRRVLVVIMARMEQMVKMVYLGHRDLGDPGVSMAQEVHKGPRVSKDHPVREGLET